MRWLFIVAFWLLVCMPILAGLMVAEVNESARVLIMVGVGALAMAGGRAMFPKN